MRTHVLAASWQENRRDAYSTFLILFICEASFLLYLGDFPCNRSRNFTRSIQL